MDVFDEVLSIYAGTRGHLDKIPHRSRHWEKIPAFIRDQKPKFAMPSPSCADRSSSLVDQLLRISGFWSRMTPGTLFPKWRLRCAGSYPSDPGAGVNAEHFVDTSIAVLTLLQQLDHAVAAIKPGLRAASRSVPNCANASSSRKAARSKRRPPALSSWRNLSGAPTRDTNTGVHSGALTGEEQVRLQVNLTVVIEITFVEYRRNFAFKLSIIGSDVSEPPPSSSLSFAIAQQAAMGVKHVAGYARDQEDDASAATIDDSDSLLRKIVINDQRMLAAVGEELGHGRAGVRRTYCNGAATLAPATMTVCSPSRRFARASITPATSSLLTDAT